VLDQVALDQHVATAGDRDGGGGQAVELAPAHHVAGARGQLQPGGAQAGEPAVLEPHAGAAVEHHAGGDGPRPRGHGHPRLPLDHHDLVDRAAVVVAAAVVVQEALGGARPQPGGVGEDQAAEGDVPDAGGAQQGLQGGRHHAGVAGVFAGAGEVAQQVVAGA
jgi:hypothetical protein